MINSKSKKLRKKYYKYIISYNINRMTTLSKELKCIGCEKIFVSKQGLEHHIASNICSKRIDRYVCEICGLDCKQKSNYEKHKNKKNPCIPKEEKNEEKINNETVNNKTNVNETNINETNINETVINETNINKILINENQNEEMKKKYEELIKTYEEIKKKYEETNIFLENQRQRFLKNEEENEKNKDEKYKKGIYHMVMNDYIDNEGIDYVIDKIINYDQTENIKNIKKYRNKIFKRLLERSNKSVPIFDVLGMGLIEGFEKEMNDIYICYNKIEEIFEIPQQIKILNNLSKKMPDNQQCIEIYNKLLEKTEDKQQKKEILKEIKKLQQ